MNTRDMAKEQLKLAKKVSIKDEFDDVRFYGGVDQAFIDDTVISAVVVMDKKFKVVERKYATAKAQMQYIPGFISYREGPAIVDAITKLEQRPDILFVDGNGILHPRKIGLASHIGILLDMPTIGVAKKLSLGKISEGKIKVDGEVLGVEVKTKEYAKAIYISPGHRVSMRTAEKFVREAIVGGHKMPEPLHEARKYVNKVRKRLLEKK
jgi:deoxyribonuclease V